MRTQRSRIGRRRKVFKQRKAHISFTGKAVTSSAGMAVVSRALDAFGIHDQLNTVFRSLDADRKFPTSVFLQQLIALRILAGNAISDTGILDEPAFKTCRRVILNLSRVAFIVSLLFYRTRRRIT